MHTKLKLEIQLYTDVITGTSGNKSTGFFIKLKVVDKDDRFEASDGPLGDYLRFGGSGFSIKSNMSKRLGSLNDDSLILPHLDKMGYDYMKFFFYDIDRYNYLKRLYETINDWSNYWWGFSEDSVSKIVVNGNTWEVVCEEVNISIMDKVY